MSTTAKILIVDDSRIFRGALEAALSGQDDLAVVGSVYCGEKALEFIQTTGPDLVTLDVDMPGLGGLDTLAAIQKLNAVRPAGHEIGVLMVSAFTRHGADVTVRALQAGAFDFVTKPCGLDANLNAVALRTDLLTKIRGFLTQRRRHVSLRTEPGEPCPPTAVCPAARMGRPISPVRAVLIAASTGGPRALATMLPELTRQVKLPILIVQHMPPEFTRSLAENLSRITSCNVVEVADSRVVEPETVHIARGGRHLVVRTDPQGRLVTDSTEQDRECGCRPSANVLFRSAAAALNGQAVAIVLTGMGNDGTAGLAPLRRAGGYVIAQDECSSVVWGMPGSAVESGQVDAVLPLGEIPAAVAKIVRGRERASA